MNFLIHCRSSWLTLALVLLLSSPAFGQKQVRENYEYAYDIPVYTDQLQAELTYPLAWGNSSITDFSVWRETARAKVRECMLMPPKPAADYDLQVLGRERRNGYEVRKISFCINSYTRTNAYLLVPDGPGCHPALNVLHDHGGHLYIGKEKMVRPFGVSQEVADDAQTWVNKLYAGHYWAEDLAQRGYVVLVTDAPLWGERGRQEGVDRNKYDRIAGNMQMLGRDLSAWMTFDDLAATDMLSKLPEVDATRIGCVGFSMGAYRAWMLAALSDHIRCTAAVCWMVTTRAQLSQDRGRAENGGFANCLPGVRQWLDYPHIASLTCPNPMLLISGETDHLFPVGGVKDAFETMHKVWDSQHAGQLLTTELWPMGHECGVKVQERVGAFLDAHMK